VRDVSKLKELKQKRLKRHVLPTLGGPTITTLNEKSMFFP